jgi:hypothetical protein
MIDKLEWLKNSKWLISTLWKNSKSLAQGRHAQAHAYIYSSTTCTQLVYNIGIPRIIEDQLPAYLGGSSSICLIRFIFYLEFRYVVLSRGMNHWLDNKHQKVLKWNQERLTREITTLVELSSQNRPDRFGKPVWPVRQTGLTGLGTDTVQRLVGLKTGLTGLSNRSDRFCLTD